MPNIEKLRALADALEKTPMHSALTLSVSGITIPGVSFNMSHWYLKDQLEDGSGCGTVCCIAGLAYELFATPEQKAHARDTYVEIPRVARHILGLDLWESDKLFAGAFYEGQISDVTPGMAAAEVRRIADEAEAKEAVEA